MRCWYVATNSRSNSGHRIKRDAAVKPADGPPNLIMMDSTGGSASGAALALTDSHAVSSANVLLGATQPSHAQLLGNGTNESSQSLLKVQHLQLEWNNITHIVQVRRLALCAAATHNLTKQRLVYRHSALNITESRSRAAGFSSAHTRPRLS